jgi:two-component system KDP operon response regulator KdpE
MEQIRRSIILVVEDNEDIRKLLRIFLELQQYLVVEARHGEEAVELAQKVSPDLILMDLNTPKMDGLKATELIRGNPKLEDIPIIVNSADGSRGIDFYLNLNNFGKGFIEYLTKPFNYEELPKLINEIIFNHKNNFQTAA